MDLGQTLVDSFADVISDLINALPAIIGAILILLVGWIVALIVGRIVRTVLDRAGADRAFEAHGREVYGDATRRMQPSALGGTIVKWLVFLVFVIAAANFLGWPQVSGLLNSFIAWLPNLIVAIIILIAAPIVGRLVRGAVESGSAQAGLTSGRMLGRVAEIAVIAFGVVVAINQVGIASDLVNILFIGVVVALALAFGLAFGLGGREVAAQVTQGWYERSQAAAARVQAASGQPSAPVRPPADAAASRETPPTGELRR